MSIEHCLTCFEALDAKLYQRSPLSLSQVQESYGKYIAASSAKKPSNAALKRVAGTTTTTEAADSSVSSSSSVSLAPSTTSTDQTSISASSSSDPLEEAPLFVTWNTISPTTKEEHLRGCIGTFSPLPLTAGIPEYALISALEDTRFSPITARELSSLQAAVTLLTDFEEVDDMYDWVIGVHGIRISFKDKGRRYGATYLPSVASEQGWDREETMESLVRKSGWRGKEWEALDIGVVRYQGKKASAVWSEYKEWRDWHEKQ